MKEVIKESLYIKVREMLTCALKTQVKESNIEIMYCNVCISFNLKLFNEFNAQNFIEYFFFWSS
jgi:hypothetical protein